MTKVIGVMSTFRPDSEVVERARQHAKQLDKLIVVDDGSPDSSILSALAKPTFEVIRLEQNSGIAAALNIGIRRALDEEADYILNLDQDSVLDSNYMECCLNTFAQATQPTRLGVVLTDHVNHEPALPPRYSPEGFGLVNEGIQSGMVISAACLNEVGLMDERLFIDCVDTEFSLRVIDHGWRIAVAPGSNITHSLGRMEPFKPFGMQRHVNGESLCYQYHPPFREYYITRNNIDLVLRNLSRRPRWVASVIRREAKPHIKVLISGPYAPKHWLAITVGAWHGIIRRRGKIPNWLAKAVRE